MGYHIALDSFLRTQGLTSADVASRAGLSTSLVSKLRQGIRQPTITAALALAELGVPMPRWRWVVEGSTARLVAEVDE